MVKSSSRLRAFSDGMSRRDIERDMENVTDRDPVTVALDEADAAPTEWTVELVAHRMVEAFETLMRMPSGIGPRMDANGWPAMLQEFSDLVDEEAMTDARAAFARDRSRPSAERIARMDEALSWSMRFGTGEPLACDAVQLWAFCKAGRFSIAGILRRRATWAKRLAENMTIAENNRRRTHLRDETAEILVWSERMAAERGLRDRTGPAYVEGRARLIAAAQARHIDARARHIPIVVAPHEAVPNKVLSRASLDRWLPRGLGLVCKALIARETVIR